MTRIVMDNINQLPVDIYMRDLYTLKKSNLLIEKINTFSFNTHKIFNLILWEFQRLENVTHTIKIPVHRMVELVGKKEVYRTKLFYQKIAKNLVQKTLDLIEPQEDAVDVTNLISRFTLEKGMIEIRVTDEFLELAGIHKSAAKEREAQKLQKLQTQLKTQQHKEAALDKNFAKDFQTQGANKKGILKYGYTKLNLSLVNSLKSKHSIMLYEYLLMKLHFHTFKKHQRDFLNLPVDLDVVRKMLCHHQKSYEDFDLFHRKVLKPALEEINEKTDLSVTFELDKSLKKVHAIIFSMQKKKDFLLHIEGVYGVVVPNEKALDHQDLHNSSKPSTAYLSDLKKATYVNHAQKKDSSAIYATSFAGQYPNGDTSNFKTQASNPDLSRVYPSGDYGVDDLPHPHYIDQAKHAALREMVEQMQQHPEQKALSAEAAAKSKKTKERHKPRLQEMKEAKKNGVAYDGSHDTEDYFQPVAGIAGGFFEMLASKMARDEKNPIHHLSEFDAIEKIIEQDNSSLAPNYFHTTTAKKDTLEYPENYSETYPEAYVKNQIENDIQKPTKKRAKKTDTSSTKLLKKMPATPKAGHLSFAKVSKTSPSSAFNDPKRSKELKDFRQAGHAVKKSTVKKPSEIEIKYNALLAQKKQARQHPRKFEFSKEVLTLPKYEVIANTVDIKGLIDALLHQAWAMKKECLQDMHDPKSKYHIKPPSKEHLQHEFKKTNEIGVSPHIRELQKHPYFSIGALAMRLGSKDVESAIKDVIANLCYDFGMFETSIKNSSAGQGYDEEHYQRIVDVTRESYNVHFSDLRYDLYAAPERRFLATYNIIKDRYLNHSKNDCRRLFIAIFNDMNNQTEDLEKPYVDMSMADPSLVYEAIDQKALRHPTLNEEIITRLRATEMRSILEHREEYFKYAIEQEWHILHHIWQDFSQKMHQAGFSNPDRYLKAAVIYFENEKGHELDRDEQYHNFTLESKRLYIAFNISEQRQFLSDKICTIFQKSLNALGLNIKHQLAYG
jgi:hypothetical protein